MEVNSKHLRSGKILKKNLKNKLLNLKEKAKKHSSSFTKEELKNSTRIFKSATPKYTWDWYLKWISSALVLSAMSIRGIPELQQLDLILSIFGIAGWVGVSIAWKDRALIMLNTVGLFFLLRNLITIWVQ
tara:strand:+ start:169 stop:558 length:390 start_codon:yes stop_codon:yes gene_type:complete